MTTWARKAIEATQTAFAHQHHPERAFAMAKYMKNVAPYIGITAPQRKLLLQQNWKSLPTPTSDQLGRAAIGLFKLPEREFQYAGYDLIQKYIKTVDEYFLSTYVEQLLETKSWWDTVDGLVSIAVSPLCRKYDATKIIEEWSSSRNFWLIRSAIGHQRGWKFETDVDYVLQICSRHWSNKEFFVAKAIGWALRDLTAIDPKSVRKFLSAHPEKNTVAVREALRGLNRI